jgi:hypothetical protein
VGRRAGARLTGLRVWRGAWLGNPARFDPNLDRQVSVAEFEAVIRQLAGVHTQADTGRLLVEDLYREVERPRDLVAVGLFEGGLRPGER